MADLADGLEQWYKEIAKTFDLSAEQKAEITGAGAKAYAEVLKKHTPVSNRDYSHGRSAGHGRKTKHLRDSITYEPGFTSDGLHSGATSVGFDSKYQDMVARFVNNGTSRMSAKEIRNMHFKDKADLEAREAVIEANARKFKEVTGL